MLDEVLELAHIPRPGPVHQGFHGISGNGVDVPVHVFGILLGEVSHQNGYVFRMISQRRRNDGEDLQPVIQIAAKEFVPHHLGQIPVRRRHQPDVDGDGACAAQSLEGLLLQSAQQLGLEIQGNVAHFIQKQSPAMRHFKAADFLTERAGEGSPLVAKQLAFEQPGGNRRAVQADKGKIPSWTQAVNGARHQLLASPGFPQDQYSRVGRRHHFHLSLQLLQGCAASDNFLKVMCGLGGVSFFSLPREALPKVGHECDPPERRQSQDGCGHQDRDASPVLANVFFFVGRASSEAQPLFVCQFVQWRELSGSEIVPHQTAGEQILAAVPHQREKPVICLGHAAKLSANDSGDGRFHRRGAHACVVAPRLLISFVTIAKVAHHTGKAPQVSVLVFQGLGNGVGPESRRITSQMPAFIREVAFVFGPL